MWIQNPIWRGLRMIRCVKKDFFLKDTTKSWLWLALAMIFFLLFFFAKQSRGEITGQSSADVRRVCELC